MSNGWDSDKKLLAILLVAAAISLTVTYTSVLAQTADGMIRKVQATLRQFTDKSSGASKKPGRASDRRGRFNPQHLSIAPRSRFFKPPRSRFEKTLLWAVTSPPRFRLAECGKKKSGLAD